MMRLRPSTATRQSESWSVANVIAVSWRPSIDSTNARIMRTSLRLALAGALAALVSASTHHTPIQVYLYPAPASLESYQSTHARAPVLSADQAQAVFSHHLGGAHGGVDEYEVLPEGHEGWVHLLGDQQESGVDEADKGRVVIIQGDVQVESELQMGGRVVCVL